MIPMTRLNVVTQNANSITVPLESMHYDLRSPVIFTGRGGSGTRLLSAMAEDCNVFLGNKINESGDSVEWAELLYELSLEKLSEITKLTRGRAAHLNIENQLGFHSQNCPSSKLVYQAQEILNQGILKPGQLWGWKLPESMLVLPELLSAFSDAKVVHIVRHPIPSSFRRTHKTSRPSNPVGNAVLESAYRSIERDIACIATDEDYWRNAATWLYQVGIVSRFGRVNLPDTRYLEIRYEDLCTKPLNVRERLVEFLGQGSRSSLMGEKGLNISKERSNDNSFADSRCQRVWNLCSEVAIALGYDEQGIA